MIEKAGNQKIEFWRVVFIVFTILTLSNSLQLLIEWSYSIDARGWWLMSLFVTSMISFIYAFAFSAIIKATCYNNLRFAITYNVFLALVLLLHAYLYYTINIDWSAINSGTEKPNTFDIMIHSDFTPFGIYCVFLFGTILTKLISKELA
jgi:hypothetical protein